MKIVNWILKALNFIKDSAELIKWIVIAVLAISAFTGFKSCSKQKETATNTIDILNSKVDHFVTLSGKNAVKVQTWKIKNKALERFNSEISAENNDLSNELAEAKQTIEDANIEAKRVKNYIKTDLIAKDSIRTEIKFINCEKVEIQPVRLEHINIDFEQVDQSILINYEYHTGIKTLVSLEKDKDQFFIWRWIFPRWLDHTITIVEDENATIDNVVSIEFNK